MQVVLNVANDNPAFGASFQDLMNTLTPEDKKEMAKELLMQWLKDPYDVEIQAGERAGIEKARAQLSSWDKEKANCNTDEYLKNTYHFKDFMRTYKTSKIVMIETLAAESVSHLKALITEKVKTDENLQKVYSTIQDDLATGFPSMVERTMQNFFVEMFRTQIPQLQMNVQSQQYGLESVRNKLGLQQ